MTKGDVYRRTAAECRQKAEKALGPTEKALWLQLSAEWLRMAEDETHRPSGETT